YTSHYVFLPAFLAGVPVRVHTAHSTAEKEIRLGKIANWLAFHLTRMVPVGVSEATARSVEKLYGGRGVAVIPNGIPTDEYAAASRTREMTRARLKLSQQATIAIHVGNFTRAKNHELLIRAFSLALKEVPGMILVLVGEGEFRSSSERLAQELACEGQVRFL